jgi:hypothetical protein
MPRGKKNITYTFTEYVACFGRVTGTHYFGFKGTEVKAPKGEFVDPRIKPKEDDAKA